MESGLASLSTLPLSRHPLPALPSGAWARRSDLRLLDALYVELAARLGFTLLTTDHRLGPRLLPRDGISR